jgi:deoxyribonuclease-4
MKGSIKRREESRDYRIGTHIGKHKSISESLVWFYEQDILEKLGSDRFKIPLQIFSGNPKGFIRPDVKLSKQRETLAKEYITENNIRLFFHAPYIINLARPSKELTAPLNTLKYDLELGAFMGVKGVVVHVGKSLKMPMKDALKNMRDNIELMMPFIDENCPLLIETPAGQGSEMLTDIDDFIKFYNDFTDEQRKKLGVCVDSCHVWSIGYNPYKYLKTLKREGFIKINLMHYNDSKNEKGSKKDRHAPIGTGYIPLKTLERCAERCFKKNIPIVTEY